MQTGERRSAISSREVGSAGSSKDLAVSSNSAVPSRPGSFIAEEHGTACDHSEYYRAVRSDMLSWAPHSWIQGQTFSTSLISSLLS
jgi:hypothetical protein